MTDTNNLTPKLEWCGFEWPGWELFRCTSCNGHHRGYLSHHDTAVSNRWPHMSI